VVKGAIADPQYKVMLDQVGSPANRVLTNKDGWSAFPFHRFERFCAFEEVAKLISSAATTALDSPAPRDILERAEKDIDVLLARPCREN
jgi:hypothetical protein